MEPKCDAVFVSFFIGTSVEPPEDRSFSEHERELFLQYTHTPGNTFKEEVCIYLILANLPSGFGGERIQPLPCRLCAIRGD